MLILQHFHYIPTCTVLHLYRYCFRDVNRIYMSPKIGHSLVLSLVSSSKCRIGRQDGFDEGRVFRAPVGVYLYSSFRASSEVEHPPPTPRVISKLSPDNFRATVSLSYLQNVARQLQSYLSLSYLQTVARQLQSYIYSLAISKLSPDNFRAIYIP